ncbi:hypothetical protein [Hugenholtzia roseola]|uniref:hypothetical protein n=1 Tax=Hugenholtzia roseola TaxID=1002 RepID=UPI00040C3FBF|nr:hypothetical protein [Hugenholtzia roseola]
MKKIANLIGTFLLFAFASQTAWAQNPQGVLDYFKILHQDYTELSMVAASSGGFVMQTSDGNFYPILLDSKNGYMQYTIEGEASTTKTVVLYRKANKDAVIGVTEELRVDGRLVNYTTQFYRYQNGAMQDITAQVLPRLTPADFLKSSADASRLSGLVDALQVCIALPRYGTVAKSNVEPTDSQAQWQQNKNKFYSNIEILWDKTLGKFKIGAKQ